MKKSTLLLLLSLLLINLSVFAQEKNKPNDFEFTVIKELPITQIQNQNRSSTCWCFSTLSFLESEIIRNGYKGDLNLSEMFVVSKSYAEKATKYVRLDGALNFSPGSSFSDALTIFKNYGIVPEVIMPGLNYGETSHVHSELDAVTKGYIDALLKNPNKRLSTAWQAGFQGILDAYLGKVPEEFEYEGKKYTPETYAKSLDINIDDYVSITSFTHVPYYKEFAIEVPDNWRWDLSYNVPLDELIEIMYNAINEGYTIAWGTDVSEKGFSRNGVATVPDTEYLTTNGSDQERWIGLSPKDKEKEMEKLMSGPVKEKEITPEMRQKEYDNKLTTDDHGMHIYGLAQDQNGTKYFMVKNSWGKAGKYKGIWYVSEPFIKYKTMNIIVNKDAIPKEIKKKLGIK
ncbi:MAG: C1 family peptidase [Bacteroidales bacterium]|jgi:aminopeptidase C